MDTDDVPPPPPPPGADKIMGHHKENRVPLFTCSICHNESRSFLTEEGYLKHMVNEHEDWEKHYLDRFGAPKAASDDQEEPDSDMEESDNSQTCSSSDYEDSDDGTDDGDTSDENAESDDENEGMESMEEDSALQLQDNDNENEIIKAPTTSTAETLALVSTDERSNDGCRIKERGLLEKKEVAQQSTHQNIKEGHEIKLMNALEGDCLKNQINERTKFGLTIPTTSTAVTLLSTDESSNDGCRIKEKGPEKREAAQGKSKDDKDKEKKMKGNTTISDNYCSICSENFQSKDELKDHYEDHDSEQVCGVCRKTFASGPSLYKHEKVHYKFPCSICELRFRSKESHDQHWQIHFGSKNAYDSNRRRKEEKLITFFNCPDNSCKRIFDSDRSLKSHIGKMHPELRSPPTPRKKKRRTTSTRSRRQSSTSTGKSNISNPTSTKENSSMSRSSISKNSTSTRTTPKNRKNKNIKVKVKGIIDSKESNTTSSPIKQKLQSVNGKPNTSAVQKEKQQEPDSKTLDALTITTIPEQKSTPTKMGMSPALINLYTELDRQNLTNKQPSTPKQPVKVPASLLNLRSSSRPFPFPKATPPVTSSSFSWPQKKSTQPPTTDVDKNTEI